jgi:hypothetical protein
MLINARNVLNDRSNRAAQKRVRHELRIYLSRCLMARRTGLRQDTQRNNFTISSPAHSPTFRGAQLSAQTLSF